MLKTNILTRAPLCEVKQCSKLTCFPAVSASSLMYVPSLVLGLKKENKSGCQDCGHSPIDLNPVISVNTTQAGVECWYFPCWMGGRKSALRPYYNSCTGIYLALQRCDDDAAPAGGAKPNSLLLKTLQVSSEGRCWACWTSCFDSPRMAGCHSVISVHLVLWSPDCLSV